MNERIEQIRDAAAQLFIRQGYSKTQISHIAKEVGVSVGTIYLDFNGKKEIMHLVLKSTIDPEFMNRELKRPITDDQFDRLEDDLIAVFKKSQTDFAKHLKGSKVDCDFKTVLSEAFDMMSRYAVGCLFIEKNRFEFKKLDQEYRIYRKCFFETMTKYLNAYIDAGKIRKVESVELTATLIIEMLSWWTMDSRYNAFDMKPVPEEMVKKICMDNLLHAYQIEAPNA